MNAIVLLGAPGAGKGTAAERIRTETDYKHISTGDMLREAVKAHTPVGTQAEAYMKRGELVPDSIMVCLVEERLSRGVASDKYMFDGFPRTIEQAKLLDAVLGKLNAKVDYVFYLDAPRELLLSRLTGRRICRSCGANYHVVNIPPKKAGVCDACGGELYQRSDDTEATIGTRLEVFKEQTKSLIEYYSQRGVLVRVDAAQHRDLTLKEILGRLKSAG